MTSDTLDELRRILDRQSIRRGEFTLTSGAKSHYYCDTKATVLSPRGAQLCGQALFDLLRDRDIEAVGGPAIGAAYLATATAIASVDSEQPMAGFVVRKQAKGHGTEKRFDESWSPDGQRLIGEGRKVAIVEDVITTGGSILGAIEAVQAAGCDVRAVATVVDRQAGGADKIRALGLSFAALFLADDHGDLTVSAQF